MIELLEQSNALVQKTKLDFERYLTKKIEWESRLIGVKGARGTGKTTLLLQNLKKRGMSSSEAAYFSLDNLYFTTHTLLDTATTFYKNGGKVLVLDEVHKYEGWSREIKNLYDSYNDLQIIFTGSSIIDISKQEADLSRRALIYELHGLSYREYLEFTGHLKSTSVFTLDELTDSKKNFRKLFPESFKPLSHFSEYLRAGYYPFFKEGKGGYHQRLQQLVRTIVEYDMAELKGFDIRNAKKMLQLLYVIAQNVPFKPKLTSLAQKSGVHRNSLNNYIHFLEEAKLLSLLYPAGHSVATLQKPEKIYLENSNLLYAISSEQPSKGTVREVFFLNQLLVDHRVGHSSKADFTVDDKLTFEIGGKNKTKKQILGLENAFVVKDDLEFPIGNSIPLWMFGFLY